MPAPRKPLRGKGSASLGRRPVRTAGGQGLQYTKGGESTAPGLSPAQQRWIIENVLGARTRKPGQPEIIESGMRGSSVGKLLGQMTRRQASQRALMAGQPEMARSPRDVSDVMAQLFEQEQARRAILAKLPPDQRAKAEELLRRFGEEAGRSMRPSEAVRQVEEMAARRGGQQPVSRQRPYRKPSVEWQSKGAQELAAKRAAAARRGEKARQGERDQWRRLYDENLARLVAGPAPRRGPGIDVLGGLEQGAKRRALLADREALLRKATTEQKRQARDMTNQAWQGMKSGQAEEARRRATKTTVVGVTKNGKRGTEVLPGVPARGAGMREIPVERPPQYVVDPERTDVGGDVTWRMVVQRLQERQAVARRAARKQRIQAVKAKRTPTQ